MPSLLILFSQALRKLSGSINKTKTIAIFINPWGEILADAGNAVGIITADLDLIQVEQARTKIPSLHHDRTYRVNA